MRRSLMAAGFVLGAVTGARSHAQSAGPPAADSRYSVARLDLTDVPSSLALFGAMDDAIAEVAGRVAATDSGPALVALIRQKTNWLRGRWRNARTDPPTFRQSFAYDVAVTRAAASDPDAARVVSVLRLLRDDIVEKADHCARSASGMATPVRVSVRTVADGRESPNWEVLYMPKIMEFATDAAGATMPFRVFSSPAVDDLAPGRYVVWARRPGAAGAGMGVVSERTTMRVGNGASRMTQDLAVPP